MDNDAYVNHTQRASFSDGWADYKFILADVC